MSKIPTPLESDGKRQIVGPELDAALSIEFARRADRLKNNEIDLAIRTQEARELLQLHCDHIRESWLDWLEKSTKIMEAIRQARVTTGTEAKALLNECADVRKFFLSDQHEIEITRLREFIELAERLRSLKQDGTLDKLADTILKLS